ncbi:hypothetical protein N7490_001791 [Penicillium lividum]|nr:hypothetical protein N7490_001791 [Penicillium lividum]
MAQTRFGQVQRLPGTVNVPMNAVRFMAFQPGQNCLITEGLNSCSAVAIVSPRAAILAHIAPRLPGSTSPHAGDENMHARMNEVAALFTRFASYFQGNHVWVVYAVVGNYIALPDQKAIIDQTLQTLSLSFTNWPYTVVPGLYRPPGHGTVVIDARSGIPEVYIDGQRMH